MRSLALEDNVGLVHHAAKKGFGWSMSLNLLLDYEDVFQEMALVYVMATHKFNPEAGVQFSTYYGYAAQNHMQRVIGKQTGVPRLTIKQKADLAKTRARNALHGLRGERPEPEAACLFPVVAGVNLPQGEYLEEDIDLVAAVECGRATPDEAYAIVNQREHNAARLSPLAALLVQWLELPPPELVLEVERRFAHDALCGRDTEYRARLKLRDVQDFIKLISDVTETELRRAVSELRNIAKECE